MVTQDYKVFIGNIPYDCRENDIHHFFRGFGRIKEVKLKVFENVSVLIMIQSGRSQEQLRLLWVPELRWRQGRCPGPERDAAPGGEGDRGDGQGGGVQAEHARWFKVL